MCNVRLWVVTLSDVHIRLYDFNPLERFYIGRFVSVRGGLYLDTSINYLNT